MQLDPLGGQVLHHSMIVSRFTNLHWELCDLAVIKSPKFSARSTAPPMRLLQGALVILVLWQISQFWSLWKWILTLCLPNSALLESVRSEDDSWEERACESLCSRTTRFSLNSCSHSGMLEWHGSLRSWLWSSFIYGFGFLVGLVNNCSSEISKGVRVSPFLPFNMFTWHNWIGIYPTRVSPFLSGHTFAWHSWRCHGWWERRAWGRRRMINFLLSKCHGCWRRQPLRKNLLINQEHSPCCIASEYRFLMRCGSIPYEYLCSSWRLLSDETADVSSENFHCQEYIQFCDINCGLFMLLGCFNSCWTFRGRQSAHFSGVQILFCWSCASTLQSPQQILSSGWIVDGASRHQFSEDEKKCCFFFSFIFLIFLVNLHAASWAHCLVILSLLETDPQILELRWWESPRQIIPSDGFWFRMLAWRITALVNRTHRIDFSMTELFRKILEDFGGSMSWHSNCHVKFNIVTFVTIIFIFFRRLFINLTMCEWALFPKPTTTLGLVEQAFWRVPFFTEWLGATSSKALQSNRDILPLGLLLPRIFLILPPRRKDSAVSISHAYPYRGGNCNGLLSNIVR